MTDDNPIGRLVSASRAVAAALDQRSEAADAALADFLRRHADAADDALRLGAWPPPFEDLAIEPFDVPPLEELFGPLEVLADPPPGGRSKLRRAKPDTRG